MKRREFIQYAGLTAAGIAGVPLSAKPGRLTEINVGIIGTGDRGTGILRLINGIDGMTVKACCDPIPERLGSAMKLSPAGAKGFSDYRRLLDDRDLDAVVIAVPYSMHAGIALNALDAGKHIYCEKTMVHDFESARAVAGIVSRHPDLVFQVGHQYHNSRLYQNVANLIMKGYCGEILGIDCQWNRNGDWRRPVSDPRYERLINWRMYREYSGGLVAELCSHQLDFINWISGANPEKVTGFGGIDYWKDGRETYDNVRLFYQYPGGMKASFTCLTTNGFNDYRIRIMGKEATIDLDYRSAVMYAEKRDANELGQVDGVSGATLKAWQQGEGISLDVDHEEPTRQALIDFGRCIREGELPISDVFTGGRVSVAVRMGLDAMENEQVQYWKPEYSVLTG